MSNGLAPYPQYSSAGTVSSGYYRGDSSSVSEAVDGTEKTDRTASRPPAFPGQDTTKPDGTPRDEVELSQEAEEIRKLQLRDREVRAHEAAHAAVGGAYAGSPSYTFERGVDGRSYAVGGSVSVDTSPVKGDPQATLQKAQQVRAAALAPAQPSAQDMKVAQKAQAMAAKARIELAKQNQPTPESSTTSEDTPAPLAEQFQAATISQPPATSDSSNIAAGVSRLDIYS